MGSGLLGAAIKHLVPWKGVNKWIPAITTVATGAYYATNAGMPPLEAALAGLITALGAKGGHDTALDHTPLGRVQLPTLRRDGTRQRL